MITWADIKPTARAVLRGWWIIVLSVGVASGTAYYVSQGETRYYVARASLMVGNTITMQQPDQYQLTIGSSLARFYAELARRSRILEPVQQSLQLPFSADVVSQYMLQTN